MAGQDEAGARIAAYTTDYYAEFYDLWVVSFWPPQWKEVNIYWDVIQSMMASRKDDANSGPINVVDIGCGTGRVLKDLLERSRDSATPLSDVKIYEVDPSETMMRRGQAFLHAHPDLQKVAPVEWVKASGEEFTSVLPQVKGLSDLVFFSGGSFSHIDTEENQLLFLRQMAAALRNLSRTAVGIILVVDECIPSRAIDPAASEMFEVPWEGQSIENPDLTYHKSANEVFWKGPVRHDRFTLHVRSAKSGEDVHTEWIEHTLLNLDEKSWPGLVQRAGLQITRVQEMDGLGIFYYMQKAA
ncbi:hypothetical protein MMC22_006123 [Lobaria immixta]|nr:hypothetical protein [Lobaria immixta]